MNVVKNGINRNERSNIFGDPMEQTKNQITATRTFVENPGKFLVDTGLLFEINRKILHPLGLALAVILGEDSKTVEFSVWDLRTDPEGIIFSKESFEQGIEKLAKYMEERGSNAIDARRKSLGYVVQLHETEA
jgi:hypothetical protein